MAIIQRLRERTGKLLAQAGGKLLREATDLSSIDPDEDRYRSLGNRGGDLPSSTHRRMVEICRYLYDTNPFAGRILDFLQELILGEGVTVKAGDEQGAQILQMHWEDEENRWGEDAFQYLLEWALSGELYLSTATNPYTGLVRLGARDPLSISRVVYDTRDLRKARGVVVKGDILKGEGEKTEKIIAPDADPHSPSYGRLRGEVFWFPFKKLWSQERGRSVLFSLADGLDAHEQYLFDRLERARLLQSFLWDVTLEGENEEGIKAWLKGQRKPRPGTIRAHNEKISWNVVAPHLNAADGSIEERMMRMHILGGAGFPEHWFGEGREANLATARAQTFPTVKRLTFIQRRFRGILASILRFQLDEAVRVQALPSAYQGSFTLSFPSIDEKDITAASTSFQLTIASLVVAGQHGWVNDEEARALLVLLFGLYGVEIPSTLPEKPTKESPLEQIYQETKWKRA